MAKKLSATARSASKPVRVSAEELRRLPSQTDVARLRARTDEAIAQGIADDPDALEFTDEMLARAEASQPERKELVSVRLDASVVAYFKQAGKGYSSRMNSVLKSYVDTKTARSTKRNRRGS